MKKSDKPSTMKREENEMNFSRGGRVKETEM